MAMWYRLDEGFINWTPSMTGDKVKSISGVLYHGNAVWFCSSSHVGKEIVTKLQQD